MNVLQSDSKGNSRFHNGQIFSNLSSQDQDDQSAIKSDWASLKYRIVTSTKPGEDHDQSPYFFNLEASDRLGRPALLQMAIGNICIISDTENNDFCQKLTAHVLASVQNTNTKVAVVKFKKFMDLPILTRITSNVIYIVTINIDQLASDTFSLIAASFHNFFITKLEEISIKCPMNGTLSSSVKIDDIIRMIGGDFILRKYLVANLARNEVLVISGQKLPAHSFVL
jgi:hypothetical protein